MSNYDKIASAMKNIELQKRDRQIFFESFPGQNKLVVTRFSSLKQGKEFRNLYGEWFYKISETQSENMYDGEHINVPAEEICYIES